MRPGPGWALVGLLRQLEKLPPSGGRTVTNGVSASFRSQGKGYERTSPVAVIAGLSISAPSGVCSGKWQAATCPGPKERSFGSSAAQRSWANWHLVRNLHSEGGFTGLGSSPLMAAPFLARSVVGLGTGMVAIRPAVYGCAARS